MAREKQITLIHGNEEQTNSKWRPMHLRYTEERRIHRLPKRIQNKEETMVIYVWNVSPYVSEDNFQT